MTGNYYQQRQTSRHTKYSTVVRSGGGGSHGSCACALGWWVRPALTRCVARHERPRDRQGAQDHRRDHARADFAAGSTKAHYTSTYILQGVEQLFLELQRNKEYADVDECVYGSSRHDASRNLGRTSHHRQRLRRVETGSGGRKPNVLGQDNPVTKVSLATFFRFHTCRKL